MTTAELIHSLNCLGLTLAKGPGDTLKVNGDVSKLTPVLVQSLSTNKLDLLSLLSTCLTDEEREREAIQFADTDEAKGLAEEVGNEFLEMAKTAGMPNDCHSELWNWIGSKETLTDLNRLSRLFVAMLNNNDKDMTLTTEINELTENRRALLVERERHNQKANGLGEATPNPL